MFCGIQCKDATIQHHWRLMETSLVEAATSRRQYGEASSTRWQIVWSDVWILIWGSSMERRDIFYGSKKNHLYIIHIIGYIHLFFYISIECSVTVDKYYAISFFWAMTLAIIAIVVTAALATMAFAIPQGEDISITKSSNATINHWAQRNRLKETSYFLDSPVLNITSSWAPMYFCGSLFPFFMIHIMVHTIYLIP